MNKKPNISIIEFMLSIWDLSEQSKLIKFSHDRNIKFQCFCSVLSYNHIHNANNFAKLPELKELGNSLGGQLFQDIECNWKLS